MKATIRAVTHQDLHALRWLLPIWILSLAVWIIGKISWFGQFHEYASASISAVSLGVAAVWFFTFGRLLFNHAPADPRAAWRTRPLSRPLVAAIKIMTGLLILVALPAAANALFNSQGELSSWKHFSEEWSTSVPKLAITTASLFFLGSLCRSSRQLLIAIPVLFLAIYAAAMVFFQVTEKFLIFRFSEEGGRIATIVYCSGFFALVVRQFQHPRLRRSIIGGIGVLLAVFILWRVFPHPRQSLSTAGVELKVLDISPTKNGLSEFTISVQGLDNSSVWKFAPSVGGRYFYSRKYSGRNSDTLLDTPGITSQLNLKNYRIETTLPTTSGFTFGQRKDNADNSPIDSGVVDLLFTLIRYDTHNLGELSVSPEATVTNPKGLTATIHRLDYSNGQRTLHFEATLGLALTRSKAVKPTLRFLLIDDEAMRASFLERSNWRNTRGPWGEKLSVELMLPEWGTPNADLRLMIVQLRQTGLMFLKPTSTPATD